MVRLVKLQLDLLLYVPFRLSNSSPLSFGSNLQQATLSTAFTQSNRSCTRCSAAIPATDFFQGQNQPPLFTPSNRVIMVYSILYISSPTRSRMAPLIGCRLSSIIKANGYQRSFCMAGPKNLVLTNLEGFTLLLGLLTNHFQPVFPDGHCRVHCSVRDRSVQSIFTQPLAAFIDKYPSLSL